MSSITDSLKNITAEHLQWIKGDKIGNVEIVAGHEDEWTVFQSGSRIATRLIHEFMIPIEGEPLNLDPPTEFIGIHGFPGSIGPGPHLSGEYTPTKHTKENPIKTLFDKQKKTDAVELKLSFIINVPAKDIFDIISMTFDEDEVVKELDLFISDQINPDVLKDTLRTSIEELIKKRYKSNS